MANQNQTTEKTNNPVVEVPKSFGSLMKMRDSVYGSVYEAPDRKTKNDILKSKGPALKAYNRHIREMQRADLPLPSRVGGRLSENAYTDWAVNGVIKPIGIVGGVGAAVAGAIKLGRMLFPAG